MVGVEQDLVEVLQSDPGEAPLVELCQLTVGAEAVLRLAVASRDVQMQRDGDVLLADVELLSGEPQKPGVCPECGGEELRHAEIEARLGIERPAFTKELCPSCRRGVLQTQRLGIWD